MLTFAEQLNAVQKKRRFTQEQLTKAVNVSRQTSSRWANGRAVPDIDSIRQLSQARGYIFFMAEDAQATPAAGDAAPQPGERPIVWRLPEGAGGRCLPHWGRSCWARLRKVAC